MGTLGIEYRRIQIVADSRMTETSPHRESRQSTELATENTKPACQVLISRKTNHGCDSLWESGVLQMERLSRSPTPASNNQASCFFLASADIETTNPFPGMGHCPPRTELRATQHDVSWGTEEGVGWSPTVNATLQRALPMAAPELETIFVT